MKHRAFLAIAVAVSTLQIAAPISAETPKEDTVRTVTENGTEEKLVCRRITPAGTRIGGQKVCKTKEEWRLDDLQARRTTQDWQRQRQATNGQ